MDSSSSDEVSVLFSCGDESGALGRALKSFSDHQVSLKHIESRPSKEARGEYDFLVVVKAGQEGLPSAITALRGWARFVKVLAGRDAASDLEAAPWFPRKIADLDRFANQVSGVPFSLFSCCATPVPEGWFTLT